MLYVYLKTLPCVRYEFEWMYERSGMADCSTPVGVLVPALSGSGSMLKSKHRAQPRSVTWKGKKLSNRSTPASRQSKTSSGRPTPCSSLDITHTHKSYWHTISMVKKQNNVWIFRFIPKPLPLCLCYHKQPLVRNTGWWGDSSMEIMARWRPRCSSAERSCFHRAIIHRTGDLEGRHPAYL